MTPEEFIQGYIQTHEGGLSLDRDDTGNWFKGTLVGSKYGVTGAVLAKYRNCDACTPAEMAALTLDEAVQIGLKLFYKQPEFDTLPWNQVTASVVDMGWGAGPTQAVKLLQRTIETADDGALGMYTARAYAEYLSDHGVETAARNYATARNAFYARIVAARPSNAKFLHGWINRTESFLSGTSWWASWRTKTHEEAPAIPQAPMPQAPPHAAPAPANSGYQH